MFRFADPFGDVRGISREVSRETHAVGACHATGDKIEKGLAGGGVGDQQRPKYSKNFPQNCVLRNGTWGHRKKGAKRAGIYGMGRISLRQPPLSANPFSKPLSLQNLQETFGLLNIHTERSRGKLRGKFQGSGWKSGKSRDFPEAPGMSDSLPARRQNCL